MYSLNDTYNIDLKAVIGYSNVKHSATQNSYRTGYDTVEVFFEVYMSSGHTFRVSRFNRFGYKNYAQITDKEKTSEYVSTCYVNFIKALGPRV